MHGALKAVTALPVVAAGWVASASALYCFGTGKMDLFRFPFGQWIQAAPYWKLNLTMTTAVIGSAAAPTLLLAVCGFGIVRHHWRNRRKLRRPFDGGLRPLEPGVTDNLGHAAFATPGQIADRFSGPGCLIGAMDRSPGALLIYDNTSVGPGHCMSFAGPGSDKTTSAVSRIWNWRGPRVVFDPSLEIGPIMADALRAEGCNVVSVGLNGSGLNALDWIDVTHPEADAHIRSAVDWIYNENATSRSGADRAGDPFWGTWGRALVACLLAHILYHPDQTEPKTLVNLRRFIAVGEAVMPTLLRGIHHSSASSMARDLAGGLMDMEAGETFSGIYSNAFAATEWLSVGVYAAVVSGHAMRTADILNRNTVVFVQLPVRTLLATPAVGRAVMGSLFNAMFHADGVGITDRILFEIDEAWLLDRLKEILLCHTTARKYKGLVHTIWQSEGQLEEVWGKDGAKTMRDTVSWRSYNAISDGDIAERLSRDLGEHSVLAYSEGDNTGQSRPWGISLGSVSNGSNTNVHEIKRRLVKADEIMRARADEMFVLARDFPHPIRCNTAPYYRYPQIAGRMQANRFVPTAAE
jgi:type IV secretion system protein VirD4